MSAGPLKYKQLAAAFGAAAFDRLAGHRPSSRSA